MTPDFKVILFKILTAIEFDTDKEAFAATFLENIQLQTMVDMIQSLPLDHQEKIKDKMSLMNADPAKIDDILKTHFSDEQLLKALENATWKHMTQWLELIKPDLSSEQQHKLLQVLQEFEPASLAPTQ